VNFTVSGTIGNKLIAPMVFIPFIENAFKHSNNKKLLNAIIVNLMINDATIEMVCNNKFDPKLAIKEPNSGLGNELIKNRLNLIYPEKHILKIENTGESYCVKLIITI
jgi:two-component system, LytTR family, sensor kinase